MAFSLPALPFQKDSLEPHMSAETLEFHHGKHHRSYVDRLNDLTARTPYRDMSLFEVVLRSNDAGDVAVYNNAAQALNHEMFWKSISPAGEGSQPSGALASVITSQFGSLEKLKKEFRFSAMTYFGSGWTWLVVENGWLRIVTTSNADSPIIHGAEPLLTLDLWEHAYYLDVQNDRAAYVDAFLDKLANWDTASARFSALRKAA